MYTRMQRALHVLAGSQVYSWFSDEERKHLIAACGMPQLKRYERTITFTRGGKIELIIDADATSTTFACNVSGITNLSPAEIEIFERLRADMNHLSRSLSLANVWHDAKAEDAL